MRRIPSLLLALTLLVAVPAAPAAARATWKLRIDRLADGHAIGIAVREQDQMLYRHDAATRRVPASNEKLLLSMALYDAVGTELSIRTTAAVPVLDQGVVAGDLWILGQGDPSLSNGGPFARSLPFTATRIRQLALNIKQAGVTRVQGSVMGAISYFEHDWYAPGWASDFPARYIPLPSALSYQGNVIEGNHIANPERRAAGALTRRLKDLGVVVDEDPGAGSPPAGLVDLTSVGSVPLRVLVRYMNRSSSNFFAEVLGKRLGVERYGQPGTIAKGASAISAWALGQGVEVVAHDSSGLSYQNRVSPGGIVRLLDAAEDTAWGEILRRGLPTSGQGTMGERLEGVRVRAKTGTLLNISALSGWVWLEQRGAWAEFSILSSGMSKSTASTIEDRIVEILESRAR